MKHIFIISSHTPYLTSLGVLEKLQIPKKDVIFIFGRDYKVIGKMPDVQYYDLSDIYYISYRNRKEKIESISKIENFIDNKINDNYTLYIPHLMFGFFQVWAHNEKCKVINFIQEAITDFCGKDGFKKISLPYKIKSWFNNLGLPIWSTGRWDSYSKLGGRKVSETFAITNHLFTAMDCKHTIIKWPRIQIEYKFDNEAVFFVFESSLERGEIEKDVFMSATEKMIRKFAKEKNYVKFHPVQAQENKDKILDLFKQNNSEVEEIPAEVPFEILLSGDDKIEVCGFSTSLVYYSFLLGHKTHICLKWLLGSDKFRKYWKSYSRHLSQYGDIFEYEN